MDPLDESQSIQDTGAERTLRALEESDESQEYNPESEGRYDGAITVENSVDEMVESLTGETSGDYELTSRVV